MSTWIFADRFFKFVTVCVLLIVMTSTTVRGAETCRRINTSLEQVRNVSLSVQRCVIWRSAQYDDIPSDTDALWIIYPSNHSIQLTGNSSLPVLRDLTLLITDVTHLHETDFQPGAFASTGLPYLETFVIVRDLAALPESHRYFAILDDTFYGLPSLQNLYLEGLGIYEIQVNAFRGLENLRRLSLKRNYIVELLPNTFIHTSNLTSLILYDNYIKNIEPDKFNGLESLTALDLALNTLTLLSAGSLQRLRSLQILDLSINDVT